MGENYNPGEIPVSQQKTTVFLSGLTNLQISAACKGLSASERVQTANREITF